VQAVTGIVFVILAIPTILIAIWSAYETRKSVDAQNRATQGALLLSCLTEFGTPDIANAIRWLRKWEREKGENFAELWADAMAKNDPEA